MCRREDGENIGLGAVIEISFYGIPYRASL